MLAKVMSWMQHIPSFWINVNHKWVAGKAASWQYSILQFHTLHANLYCLQAAHHCAHIVTYVVIIAAPTTHMMAPIIQVHYCVTCVTVLSHFGTTKFFPPDPSPSTTYPHTPGCFTTFPRHKGDLNLGCRVHKLRTNRCVTGVVAAPGCVLHKTLITCTLCCAVSILWTLPGKHVLNCFKYAYHDIYSTDITLIIIWAPPMLWCFDTEGVRTPAGRAQWISSPSP